MLKVRDIMHSPVISVDGGQTLNEAAVLMDRHGIGSLIVSEGVRPVGILTERDFIGLAARNVSADSMKVEHVMSKSPMTILADSTLEEAGEQMARYGIRRLPVVEGGKLIGIVTSRDILTKMLQENGYDSIYA